MIEPFRFACTTALHPGVALLRAEASSEGFRFVDRLIDDWKANINRFELPGERLLGAFSGSDLVGICGLNRDPYSGQDAVCRLRHLYVRRNFRRAGIGSTLVQQLLNEGSASFRLVRIRTDSEEAAAFYLRLGFVPVTDKTASHIKTLGGQ